MARSVMLGNGQLTVGLNEQGLVHDFYYPYVGLDNLTTARSMHHKLGIWVDGRFSWVGDDPGWQSRVDFDSDALVSNITWSSDELGVEVHTRDFVDPLANLFCRLATVTNHHDQKRNIRLFFHQVFQISRAGRADTALYEPDGNYIYDYKGRCGLLIYARRSGGEPFDQYSIGNYGIEGREGTYRDAEDGELSGNAVEHGGVDSVLRLSCDLEPGTTETFEYWIAAADSQASAEKLHESMLEDELTTRLARSRNWWADWLAVGADRLSQIQEPRLSAVKKSLMMIKVHTDKRGGIIASCDSSIYNYGRDYYSYVWPRDGAYAIWPLIRLGYKEEPKKFFEFCRDIMLPEGYLMHKYQPDRAIGSTWHPLVHGRRRELAIQEDETALVLYMLGEYVAHSDDDAFASSLYQTFVQPAAHFLADFLDEATGLPHASYDLWEEKFATHTYTAAITYQALLVAADFAEQFEYPDDAVKWKAAAETIAQNASVFFSPERGCHRKSFLLEEDGSLKFDNVIDISSFYGVVMYAGKDFGEGHVEQAARTIEQTLLDQSPAGGAPRYEHDNYFASSPQLLGNPWIVTTLWMAQYYVRVGQDEKANGYVEWALSKALPSGILSEQVNPTTSEPLSVTPLVWSHAELVNTILDLSKVKS